MGSKVTCEDKFKEVNPDTGYKEIIAQFFSLIEAGELKPGQILPGERILAERFKTGRETVRVALKFLEFVGVIVINVGKGAFISKKISNLAFIHMLNLMDVIQDNPFKDLMEARRVIETKMAALAAVNATEEDLSNMENSLAEMKKDIQKRGKGVHGTDKFHLAIYKASKNIILYKIGLMLQGLMHESRGITLAAPGRAAISLEEHGEIYQAIKRKDSYEAARLMDNHLAGVARSRALI
jgi:GntR family transcriptional repressor for pyruvate dehydrogenase complex